MLALANGMDVVKSPNLMGGKEYKGYTKNKGISLEMLLMELMFHYNKWRDAVNSPNPNGC